MSLRTFCLRIFQHCPLLASFSVENHTKAFEEFLQYKTRIPVRGAIMLNHAMDSVVLVKGWKKGANWSFPRGKINKDEDDLDCAVREVYEETGLDLKAAGLVPTEKRPKYIEISMREQQLRLYVFRDVPMDTNFQPRTRKEISKIQWYKLSELPAFRKKGAQSDNDASKGPAINKFYMVAPFLVPLKKWIHSQKKIDEKKATSGGHGLLHQHYALDEAPTTEDDAWAPKAIHQPPQVGHTPAIDTLDGATQELQRLLKMQPPTQGLQPTQSPRQDDKGSALLSILQSNNAQHPLAAPKSREYPHTPFEVNVSQPPQPQNPHHHHNEQPHPAPDMQQPLPPFSLPQNPQVTQGINNEVSQIPNSIEQSQMAHAGNIPLQMPLNWQEQAPLPMQNHQAGHGGMPLSGKSLALLNAFKRDTGHGSPVQGAASGPGEASNVYDSRAGQQVAPLGGQPGSQNTAPLATEPRRLPYQRSISELVGSTVHAPQDQHRSTLLGMFKKSPEPAGGIQPPPPLDKLFIRRDAQPLPTDENGLPHLLQQPADRGLTGEQQALRPLPRPQNENPAIGLRGMGSPGNVAFSAQRSSAQHSPALTSPNMLPDQFGGAMGGQQQGGSLGGQKQQLLSLFGKQQVTSTASPNAGLEHVFQGRQAKSRTDSGPSRGDHTPISPAEQTFLLDYLQSVTNNAGRR